MAKIKLTGKNALDMLHPTVLDGDIFYMVTADQLSEYYATRLQILQGDGTPAAINISGNAASNITRLNANVTENAGTFKNLTDLSRTFADGEIFNGYLVIKCSNTVAIEGIKFDFNGGNATITSFWAGAGILASGGTDVVGANISTTLAGVINFTTLTGESIILIHLNIVCNVGGTFIPRIAVDSHTTGVITAKLGSYMKLEKV